MTLTPGEARYQGTRDQEAVEWGSLAGQMKSRYCPEKHCSRLGMWCENHPPDFQSTRPCYKHECLSPTLLAEGFMQLPRVALNFTPPPWIFLPYGSVFNITAWLGTRSWFISVLTMVQKNRPLGVAKRIRSWILMLVRLISENFPRSLNFLLSSWTLVQPLNGGIWIFKNFFQNRVLWNGSLSSGR